MKKTTSSIFVVAGEASGDLLASRVVRILKKRNPRLKIFGLGGPALSAAGMEVREDLTRQALIGFVEVLKHLPKIRQRFVQCEKWFREERPDLLFLVDYPGFNLRLAEQAHRLGIPVCYYVAPQAWAWHESRVQTMKKILSKLLVIFPFEEPWFRERGMKALYVGHPLTETVKWGKPKSQGDRPRVCVMPGSRRGELERLWPLMRESARRLRRSYPKAQFVVPIPSTLSAGDYPGLTPEDSFSFVKSEDLRARGACHVAWVKSGTATVETALLGTPMIITYQVAPLTAFIARRVATVKYVGMVNLLSHPALVPELLQEDACPEKLVAETLDLLESPSKRRGQIECFRKMRKLLSIPVHASANVARQVEGMLP